MTEEEYDLKNTKLAKRRKYILAVSIMVFLLTSYYVGLFINLGDFFLTLFVDIFLGLNVGALLIGLRITSRINLQWIFSFGLMLVIVSTNFLASFVTDELSRDQRFWARTLVLINSVSLAFSLGLGIFVSFNSEIERIAKLIWLAKPKKENVLKIEKPEVGSN